MKNKIRLSFNLMAALAICLLGSSLVQAQASRTWVSGVGDDANPCSRTAPCKTFAGAISKTAAGGEISVLDPGGYGAVTITKAITINGAGTLAGILAAGTNGIIVNAGANDVVIIRDISINGFATGLNGIRYLAGKQLIVENVVIDRFTQQGIDVNMATAGKLTVNNSSITNCVIGTRLAGAGLPKASLNNVTFTGNSVGFNIAQGSGTISNSTLSHNTGQAIQCELTSVINVQSCVISNNGTGVSAANAGSIVRISNCDILNNTTGINIGGGATVASFGNNKNAGNTTPGAPNSNLTQQ